MQGMKGSFLSMETFLLILSAALYSHCFQPFDIPLSEQKYQ